MDRFVVAWSPQVRDDLNDIAAHVAKDSPRRATEATNRILAAGRDLEILPWRGHIVPELGLNDHREIHVHEYRIIYRVGQRAVQVLAVIHGRRLLGNSRLGE